MKTYVADTPLNSATITPKKDFVILGGGQAAMDVTTTSCKFFFKQLLSIMLNSQFFFNIPLHYFPLRTEMILEHQFPHFQKKFKSSSMWVALTLSKIARQGKFEARFYHKVFEEEIGRVRGHFGPLSESQKSINVEFVLLIFV